MDGKIETEIRNLAVHHLPCEDSLVAGKRTMNNIFCIIRHIPFFQD
ncbi:hypothetical protein SAMN02982927_00724 [Sporolactobacillus nakayamae]|uniref:Uncharacterized protein n=1 Tax=Sporolactobacillus nakayamae TaxID=269670 RepID=A0A1I2P5J5_9BACL|nr:hypothetical protein SAMN02982927_00724 [Sporolactobacillus nakayamae]